MWSHCWQHPPWQVAPAHRKSIVHQPTSVGPVPQPEPLYGNGAIFQSNSRGSLFEDRAARRGGDVLTVSIEEKLSAKSKSSSNANRSGSLSQTASTPLAAPYLPGVLEKVANAGYKLESANKFDGKGETNAENTFTGNITVTVVEVLANGNLVVSGENRSPFITSMNSCVFPGGQPVRYQTGQPDFVYQGG